jgi:hypothetical protein
MLLIEGIVLGHLISLAKIKVYPTKIKAISNLDIPRTQKYV